MFEICDCKLNHIFYSISTLITFKRALCLKLALVISQKRSFLSYIENLSECFIRILPLSSSKCTLSELRLFFFFNLSDVL